jgi:hypothetical protein
VAVDKSISRAQIEADVAGRRLRIKGKGQFGLMHSCSAFWLPEPTLMLFESAEARMRWINVRPICRKTLYSNPFDRNDQTPTNFSCDSCQNQCPMHQFVAVC